MIAQAILARLQGVDALAGVRLGIGVPEVEAGDKGTVDVFVDVPIAEDDSPVSYADGTIDVYAATENRRGEIAQAVTDALNNTAIPATNIIRIRVIDSSSRLETDSLFQTALTLEIMTRGN